MPAPPYSVGKMVPISPSLPSSLTVSSGKVPGSSHFITLGAISRSAKSRTIFFNCSCSSESWKSKPFLQIVEGVPTHPFKSAPHPRHVLRALHQSQRPVRNIDKEVRKEPDNYCACCGDGQRQAHRRARMHRFCVDGLAHQHRIGNAHVIVEAHPRIKRSEEHMSEL